MAMESVGLGVKLLFDGSRAVTGIGRVEKAFNRLGRRMDRTGRGVTKVTSGIMKLTMATAPLSIGFAWGMKKAMDFEQAMANVGSVTLATAEDMAKLELTAKRLGATTAFSATQAGNAMEFLGRAGFKTTEIITAMPAVLNMAAADSMGLAEAADIVANVMKAMDIRSSMVANRLTGEMIPATSAAAQEWEKAGISMSAAEHVADVLALTSASANTNIHMLGEAFRFVAPTARQMEISIEETSAALGLLANAGLKASMGGTSLRNMMLKLAAPSQKVLKLFGGKKGFNQIVNDTQGQLRPLPDIILSVMSKLKGMTSVTEKAAMVQEMFGIRGQGAYAALEAAGKRTTLELMEKLQKASAVTDESGNMIGAAALMAQKRLSTLRGAITLLGSAMEGFSIETMGRFVPGLSSMTTSVTAFIGDLAVALQFLNMSNRVMSKDMIAAWDKIPPHIRETAAGIKEGIDTAINFAKRLHKQFIQPVINWFTQMEGASSKTFGKWATIIGLVSVALVPLLGALVTVGFAVSGLGMVISGLATVVAATFWPLVVVALALGAAFAILRRDGETTFQTIARVSSTALATVKQFWSGLSAGFKEIMPMLKGPFTTLWNSVLVIFEVLGIKSKETSGKMGTDWVQIGRTVAAVIGAIAVVVARVFTVVALAVSGAIKVVQGIIWVFKALGLAIAAIAFVLIHPIQTFKMLGETVVSAIYSIFPSVESTVDKIAVKFLGLKTQILQYISETITSITAKFNELLAMPIFNRIASFFKGGTTTVRVVGGGAGPAGAVVSGATTSPSGEMPDLTAAIARAGGLSVERQAAIGGGRGGPVVVEAPPAPPPPPITVYSNLYVDGRQLLIATSQAQVEHDERAGKRLAPVHKRSMTQMGASV